MSHKSVKESKSTGKAGRCDEQSSKSISHGNRCGEQSSKSTGKTCRCSGQSSYIHILEKAKSFEEAKSAFMYVDEKNIRVKIKNISTDSTDPIGASNYAIFTPDRWDAFSGEIKEWNYHSFNLSVDEGSHPSIIDLVSYNCPDYIEVSVSPYQNPFPIKSGESKTLELTLHHLMGHYWPEGKYFYIYGNTNIPDSLYAGSIKVYY